MTEGSKLNTDPRFTTASTKDLYEKWACEEYTLSGDTLTVKLAQPLGDTDTLVLTRTEEN